jgi:PA14 domain
MSSELKIAGFLTMLAITLRLAAQEPPQQTSTTIGGEQPYTFGTTVVANSGFRGEIYLIPPGTRKLPNFSRLKPVGAIYTPCLNVPSHSFATGFPGVTDRFEWFAIDYVGRFWISEPGIYRFALASDDGSILYIDGRQLIQNDGVHAILEKVGEVNLKTGAHTIRVSYFQGPRFQVALILRVADPGEDKFRVFQADDFKPPVDARW